ncbi:MAG TPA: hypothetical protein VLN57_21270 [Xanthobacteraceae bacterium]|nr:hypothetical protein [Xanthobacteraceae bacterium]
MTTDLYSTELWSDGQEVDTSKLNNSQRFVQATIFDQILQSKIASLELTSTNPDLGGENGPDAPLLYAYCVSPGAAYLRAGSANNKVQIAPGTLLQKVANSDGQGATLIPFTFAGTEEFTFTNGDASNPRVDLLQMALSYISDTTASVDFQDAVTRAITSTPSTPTKRRVLCTLSVKAGTPAASPTIPDPDSGSVPVGSIFVPATWNATATPPLIGFESSGNATVHDQRMPLGVHVVRVDPALFKLKTGWSLTDFNSRATASSGTNELYAILGLGPGRIIAIDVYSTVALSTGTVTIGWLDGSSNPTTRYLKTNTVVSASSGNVRRSQRVDFEGAHNPETVLGAYPIIQKSAVNKIGMPLWTSGIRVPQDNSFSFAPGWATLQALNLTNGAIITFITFYIADGL